MPARVAKQKRKKHSERRIMVGFSGGHGWEEGRLACTYGGQLPLLLFLLTAF